MSFVFKRLSSTATPIRKTALYELHTSLGGTMVPFAGYSMPVKYAKQTHIQSHNWTREHAGLFDVSHMLQSSLSGPEATKFLHKITPTDFSKVPLNQGTLSVLLLPETGGIVDDTLITKQKDDQYYIVTNAGCIEQDTKFFRNQLKDSGFNCNWEPISGRALLALQGPTAHLALKKLVKNSDGLDHLFFGCRKNFQLNNGVDVEIARCGYTGEDGFEISIPNEKSMEFAEALLRDAEVEPIGLAARDSLRLEAGMCLYGHELNTDITPVEASLNWVISKSRRGEGGSCTEKFNGFSKIMDQLNNKSYNRVRVGFQYLTRGPAARHETRIFDADGKREIGVVTSGSASPSLQHTNIGQAFVERGLHKKGTKLTVQVRNRFYPIEIVRMPFVPTHYYKPNY
ncbi:probable Aminomethyltransferase, mitochondrial [Saccharomycodes ludwigii]|uniref:Aminomethyltransferase n=1 Tax=Saccharomycodes ludwigii TaxID=36035 RepID=A0A376BAR2_9ASCO|nr:probable Aminomethyltransferase, mitochondrial [Saccharomycodes ludwigii]